ncbi:hypothetical protein LLH06_17565 [Mucilaginibacter daejeonensis]|uniref:hypothetical protein n=1 Tax=Mucilaginibacter daejeonensis TaxID=398049 RepID=UPI001D17BB5D|nr:hypothetical protein [Mucilaginibacter daejeonensis]UEG52756.1 hypothetical protein LLH06_17565 [Mucilaginibacter daejeonensis]
MKKDEIPQDPGALGRITKEVCYATDASGKYTTELSSGWDVKIQALNVAWEDIDKRIAVAKQKVLDGQASPIYFFMEYRLMDVALVADYTGFWQWQVKRHLKPEVFKGLNDTKLQKYALAFNTTVDDLRTMTVHDDRV